MGRVIELSAHRHDQHQKLFDTHRSALTELICAYAHMDDPDYSTALEKFLAAQRRYVDATLALDKATGER
jgi:hypothetical protein